MGVKLRHLCRKAVTDEGSLFFLAPGDIGFRCMGGNQWLLPPAFEYSVLAYAKTLAGLAVLWGLVVPGRDRQCIACGLESCYIARPA